MSKFNPIPSRFDTRDDVKDHLNNKTGFEVPVYEYGTQNLLYIPTSDGIGAYEFSQIRDVGYQVSHYDEVNDNLVLEPRGDE